MSVFESFPDHPNVSDVFHAFPATVGPLKDYHLTLLRRTDSPFSIAQRELIAAFTSGTNACAFCYGSHRSVATAFGVDENIFDRLMKDVDSSGVDSAMVPVLKFVRKLTLTPSRITDSDRLRVLNAGWSEEALFESAFICGLFNLMNRIVEATGCHLVDGRTDQLKDRNVALNMYGEVSLS
jgi:uncharacterized peroxidase-related enzyme